MKRFEPAIEWALFLCALLSIGITIGIIVVLAVETWEFLREVPIAEFLFGTEWTPLFAMPRFGVLPLVTGTALVSSIAMVVALPMGLLSAIYLSEYADPRVRRTVKPILEVLAGVPTVVYGYFALLFLTPLLQRFIPDLAGFKVHVGHHHAAQLGHSHPGVEQQAKHQGVLHVIGLVHDLVEAAEVVRVQDAG